MRNHIAVATLVFLFLPAVTSGQMSANAPNEFSEVRSQLNEALQLLQQTRKELQDSQAQIKALRSEVDSIKASLPSGTQTPSATTPAAVEQLTEAQAITDSRIEQLYQTKVESGSKYRVSLSGMVLFNSGWNRGAVDNSDVPMLARKSSDFLYAASTRNYVTCQHSEVPTWVQGLSGASLPQVSTCCCFRW